MIHFCKPSGFYFIKSITGKKALLNSILSLLLVLCISCDENKESLKAIAGMWNLQSVEFTDRDSIVHDQGSFEFTRCKDNQDCNGKFVSKAYGEIDFIYSFDATNNILQLNTIDIAAPVKFEYGLDLLTPEMDGFMILEGSVKIKDTNYPVELKLVKE